MHHIPEPVGLIVTRTARYCVCRMSDGSDSILEEVARLGEGTEEPERMEHNA